MKQLNFSNFTIIMAFLFVFVDLGVYMVDGTDLKFMGKFGFMFLTLNLLIVQLKNK